MWYNYIYMEGIPDREQVPPAPFWERARMFGVYVLAVAFHDTPWYTDRPGPLWKYVDQHYETPRRVARDAEQFANNPANHIPPPSAPQP